MYQQIHQLHQKLIKYVDKIAVIRKFLSTDFPDIISAMV